GMYKFRKKRAYALSGGQQQRVSIARALVKQAKIIIADEPTGNLDSENTIEVMNILKKISKTSLVLVVTHNEEVANFYSDEVIRIRDGSIIDSYKNDGSQSLNTQQSNTIYLKDMDHSLISNEQANVHMYTNETAPVINLDIMYVNGTFYLRSDSKIKISADTNIKILDEHKKSIDLETIEKHDYDTSWFSSPKKRPNPFGMFWQSFVKSYNKIRYSRKRTKVLYFAFILVGILLAACVVGYSNFSTIDDSSFVADSHYDQLYNNLYVSYSYENEFMYKNLTKGNISDVEKVVSFSVAISRRVNFNEQVTGLLQINAISASTRKISLECGKMPAKGEILISRRMADDIIKEYGYFFSSYEALMGQNLKVARKLSEFFPEEFVISGIANTTTNLNYINDEDYMSVYSTIFEVKTSLIPNIKWRHWPVETEYNTYTVVAGRDLDESDRVSHNILMPSNYPNAEKYLAGVPLEVYNNSKDRNPSLGGGGLELITSYSVVGLFELNDAPTTKED
ncbi:MAG: ATP-binding cassette domain-containing protein, partial [Anaeroplasmataceae bacterium]|nr:ATP-binding cassette domain-containing protein [Anaeroplasmataceae bacterium]